MIQMVKYIQPAYKCQPTQSSTLKNLSIYRDHRLESAHEIEFMLYTITT